MPRKYYYLAGAGFVAWAALIWALANGLVFLFGIDDHNDKPGRVVELTGTLITLLPVALDLFRKYYVRRVAPPRTDRGAYADWAHARLMEAYLGYERLYGYAVFVGVSLVALGFAVDLAK